MWTRLTQEMQPFLPLSGTSGEAWIPLWAVPRCITEGHLQRCVRRKVPRAI